MPNHEIQPVRVAGSLLAPDFESGVWTDQLFYASISLTVEEMGLDPDDTFVVVRYASSPAAAEIAAVSAWNAAFGSAAEVERLRAALDHARRVIGPADDYGTDDADWRALAEHIDAALSPSGVPSPGPETAPRTP